MPPLKRLAIDVVSALLLAVLDVEGVDILVVPIAVSGSAAPIPKQHKGWGNFVPRVVGYGFGDLAANQPHVAERVVVAVGGVGVEADSQRRRTAKRACGGIIDLGRDVGAAKVRLDPLHFVYADRGLNVPHGAPTIDDKAERVPPCVVKVMNALDPSGSVKGELDVLYRVVDIVAEEVGTLILWREGDVSVHHATNDAGLSVVVIVVEDGVVVLVAPALRK